MRRRSVARIAPVAQRAQSHAFSASNIGPANVGEDIDPFIGIDHFVMRVPVFPPHPHAGFSALTYLFEDSEGSFTNRDSLGHSLLIAPGDLHWTTAGRGIIHEEIPEVAGQRIHGLQIFVNLPSTMKHVAPSIHHVTRSQTPLVEQAGMRVRVVAGAFEGVSSPLESPTPITLLDVRLDAGACLSHPLPGTVNVFVYVLDGEVAIGPPTAPRYVQAGQVASLAHDGDALEILGAQRTPAWLVVFAGEPIGEPLVSAGPFVMNTEREIERAYADYRSGRMGKLSATPSAAWLSRA